MYKKIAHILLILLIATFLFVGCNNDDISFKSTLTASIESTISNTPSDESHTIFNTDEEIYSIREQIQKLRGAEKPFQKLS